MPFSVKYNTAKNFEALVSDKFSAADFLIKFNFSHFTA